MFQAFQSSICARQTTDRDLESQRHAKVNAWMCARRATDHDPVKGVQHLRPRPYHFLYLFFFEKVRKPFTALIRSAKAMYRKPRARRNPQLVVHVLFDLT